MTKKHTESGSALFYILIAVALIAALSFAVTRSSNTGVSSLSKEQLRLYASELIEYSNNVANAVAKLRLNGTTETDLCFDDPAWPVSEDYDHSGCASNINKIFHTNGGKIIWQKAPVEAMDPAATPDYLWHITGANHITDIGSECEAADCSELLISVNEISKDVCIKINEILSITNPAGDPPIEAIFTEEPFKGVYGDEDTIGADANSPLKGQKAGCMYVTAESTYRFYRVLRAR